MNINFAAISWDPDRFFFVIPYIHHPVTWYGFLFAFGFLVGYYLVRKIFTAFLQDSSRSEVETRLLAIQLADRLAIWVVIGTIVGARLGHVFFYGWSYFRSHLFDILKIWEGGLASHGGAIGVLLGLLIFLFYTKRDVPKLTFIALLDTLVVPAAFAGGCIRIGNFLNQEITGIATSLPWAVAFQRPVDGLPGLPVHPVQLYESFFYFGVFALLFTLWAQRKERIGSGLLSGLFFVLVFVFRFLVEYLKQPQNEVFDTTGWIRMGQLLSLPFVLLGLFLLFHHYARKKS